MAVLIPTRDRQDLLANAVRSALAQTYDNIEVFVFDDGSVPPVELPPDIASDPRLRLLRSDQGIGAPEARNQIVRHETEAPLIAFLDDDDEWSPVKIARDVDALASSDDPNAAVVESGFELWDNDRLVYIYVPDLERDLKRALLKECILVPSAVLMRRDAYLELDGMDPTLDRTHDWDLWIRMADRYGVISLPEVNTYRKFQALGPRLIYSSRRALLRRIAPRIRALPLGPRLATRAYHYAVLGVSVLRMVVGDRIWRGATDPLRRGKERVKRMAGEEPYVNRW